MSYWTICTMRLILNTFLNTTAMQHNIRMDKSTTTCCYCRNNKNTNGELSHVDCLSSWLSPGYTINFYAVLTIASFSLKTCAHHLIESLDNLFFKALPRM